jgi:hypothetical protein
MFDTLQRLDPGDPNVLGSEEYNSDIIISARISEQHRKLYIHDDMKPIDMTQRRKSS